MNFGASSSDSQAKAGLRGTNQFEPAVGYAGGSLADTAALAKEASSAPFGTYAGRAITDFMPVGRFGMHPSTDSALQGLFSDQFNKSSASMARRGNLSPEGFQGAVSGAGAEWAKTAFPQIQAYQQYLAELAPRLYGQRLGFAAEPARIAAPLLGSESTADSSGFGFGVLSGTSASDAKKAIG